MKIDDIVKEAEQGGTYRRFEKSRYYTLREVANKFNILKRDRRDYFKILREAGLISYNNRPTDLAQACGLFKSIPWYKKEPAKVTYLGVVFMSNMRKMIYIRYPWNKHFNMEDSYLWEKKLKLRYQKSGNKSIW